MREHACFSLRGVSPISVCCGVMAREHREIDKAVGNASFLEKHMVEQGSKGIDIREFRSVLFQPLVHPVCDLEVVLLHEEHVPVSVNAFLAEIRKLYIYTNLLEILDGTVVGRLME
jgi:hypothetical protein